MIYPALPRARPTLRNDTKFRINYCILYQLDLLNDMAVGIKQLEHPRNLWQVKRLLAARANEREVRRVMVQLRRYELELFNGN